MSDQERQHYRCPHPQFGDFHRVTYEKLQGGSRPDADFILCPACTLHMLEAIKQVMDGKAEVPDE